jgi:hypothetical protein
MGYFWCILEWNGQHWGNSGHCGYGNTVGEACDQAYERYGKIKDEDRII